MCQETLCGLKKTKKTQPIKSFYFVAVKLTDGSDWTGALQFCGKTPGTPVLVLGLRQKKSLLDSRLKKLTQKHTRLFHKNKNEKNI